MEVSLIIEEWLRLMSGIQGARVAAILQERYQPLFDSRFNQDLNAEPESDLEGRHVLVKGDTRTEGFFHNGRLIGNVLETSKQERALYFCKRGVKHGFWHKVDTRNGTVLELGRYENGAKAGVWWRRLEGDGFLVREYSAPDDYAVFVYPDFKTCLEGTFEDLVMLSATENTVDRVKEDFGILVPVLKSKTDKSQVFYKREDRNSESICSSPQLPDPYESKSVQVRESGIPNAGEGLFAREAIKAGRVVAYFNGAVSPGSSSSSGQLKSSEYSIALDEKSVLDIPEGKKLPIKSFYGLINSGSCKPPFILDENELLILNCKNNCSREE